MARILVIDDDPALRRLLRVVLQQTGHEVEEAGDGGEGLRLLREWPGVELVLCDLFMDGTDGLQTIREVRRVFPELPVVAMSGGGCKGAVDVLPLARALGAAGCLRKPFGLQTLVEAVETVLTQTPAPVA